MHTSWCSHYGQQYREPQKTTNRTPCEAISLLSTFPEESMSAYQIVSCISASTAARFITHEGMDKEMVAHIHYGVPHPPSYEEEKKLSKKWVDMRASC